jgi:hypothetical protein
MGLNKYLGLLFSFLYLGVSSSLAQNKTIVIHGRVTDSRHIGISYAGVQNVNTGQGINTDARGFYIFKLLYLLL